MKSKTAKLDGTPITVREMTVEEIAGLFDMDETASIVDRMEYMLSLCSDIDIDIIRLHAPSDLQDVTDALVEVNSSFFAQADQVGMKEAAKPVENLFRSLSMIVFVRSSSPDTVKKSGNTAGHSS